MNYVIETYGSMNPDSPDAWMRTSFHVEKEEAVKKAERYRSTGATNRVVDMSTGKHVLKANDG